MAGLRLGALPSTATTASLGILLGEGVAGWNTLPDAAPLPA